MFQYLHLPVGDQLLYYGGEGGCTFIYLGRYKLDECIPIIVRYNKHNVRNVLVFTVTKFPRYIIQSNRSA